MGSLQSPEGLNPVASLLEGTTDLDTFVLELVLKMNDSIFCTTIIPNNSTAKRSPTLTAPRNCCLTLIGDTCSRDLMMSKVPVS